MSRKNRNRGNYIYSSSSTDPPESIVELYLLDNEVIRLVQAIKVLAREAKKNPALLSEPVCVELDPSDHLLVEYLEIMLEASDPVIEANARQSEPSGSESEPVIKLTDADIETLPAPAPNATDTISVPTVSGAPLPPMAALALVRQRDNEQY